MLEPPPSTVDDDGDDLFPAIGEFRGVRLFAFQPEARIERVVIPEIRRVFGMTATGELLAFLHNISHSPEARMLAERRLLEPAEQARDQRRAARVDGVKARALAAGIDSFRWADSRRHNSVLQVRAPGEPQAIRRTEPYLSAMLAEKEARREAGRRRYLEFLAARGK
ncbi:MAG: hypothetical protein EKK29_03085 [Hyphomicrobiales bacterium]|nr:MAG: hypothetical protein EKK29_03085 [Hyphomicrobiales bacterium]